MEISWYVRRRLVHCYRELALAQYVLLLPCAHTKRQAAPTYVLLCGWNVRKMLLEGKPTASRQACGLLPFCSTWYEQCGQALSAPYKGFGMHIFNDDGYCAWLNLVDGRLSRPPSLDRSQLIIRLTDTQGIMPQRSNMLLSWGNL